MPDSLLWNSLSLTAMIEHLKVTDLTQIKIGFSVLKRVIQRVYWPLVITCTNQLSPSCQCLLWWWRWWREIVAEWRRVAGTKGWGSSWTLIISATFPLLSTKPEPLPFLHTQSFLWVDVTHPETSVSPITLSSQPATFWRRWTSPHLLSARAAMCVLDKEVLSLFPSFIASQTNTPWDHLDNQTKQKFSHISCLCETSCWWSWIPAMCISKLGNQLFHSSSC